MTGDASNSPVWPKKTPFKGHFVSVAWQQQKCLVPLDYQYLNRLKLVQTKSTGKQTSETVVANYLATS